MTFVANRPSRRLRSHAAMGSFCGAILILLSSSALGVDLLITSTGSNSVLRYNGTTGAFVDEFIPGVDQFYRPIGLAMSGDRKLYVSGSGSDNVLRYDGNTGTFSDEFIAPGEIDYPLNVHFGPDGNLYVGALDTNSIRKYDPTSGAFLGTAASEPTLKDPLDFTFGPGGDIFVSGYLSGAVYQFTADGAFVRTIGDGSTPWGITFGPDGNLYVASHAGSAVGRFDGTTFDFIDVFATLPTRTGAGDIEFGPDGNLYVATWNDAAVLRFDGSSGAFIDQFVTPGSGGLSGPKALLFTTVPEPSGLVLAVLSGAVVLVQFARRRSQ